MNRFVLRVATLAAIALATMAPQMARDQVHIVNLTPYTVEFWLKSAEHDWELNALEPEGDSTYPAGDSGDPLQIYVRNIGDGTIRLLESKSRWALTWDPEKSIVVVKKIEQ